MLTSLQLSQLNLFINLLCFSISRWGRGPAALLLRSVSWAGHLGGVAAGCIYTEMKRQLNNNSAYGSFINLSRAFSAEDW